MTTEDVIKDIRIFLHDPDAHRWSDGDILLYINKALGDIAVKTNAFIKVSAFKLMSGVSTYALPDDTITVYSVWFRGCKLDVVSSISLDECDSCWITTRGAPTTAVADYRTLAIRLIPIPDKNTKISVSLEAELNPQAGTVSNVNIHEKPASIDLTDDTELLSYLSRFDGLTVWYSYRPKINQVSDQIPLISWVSDLIKHYVCGHLLRADRDSNSRALGNEELVLYENAIRVFKRRAQNHFTSGLLRDLSTVFSGCNKVCGARPMQFCSEEKSGETLSIVFRYTTVPPASGAPAWFEYKNNLKDSLSFYVTAEIYSDLFNPPSSNFQRDDVIVRVYGSDGTFKEQEVISTVETLKADPNAKVSYTATLQRGDILVIAQVDHIPKTAAIPKLSSKDYTDDGIIAVANNIFQLESTFESRIGGLSYNTKKYYVYVSNQNNAAPARAQQFDKIIEGIVDIRYK